MNRDPESASAVVFVHWVVELHWRQSALVAIVLLCPFNGLSTRWPPKETTTKKQDWSGEYSMHQLGISWRVLP